MASSHAESPGAAGRPLTDFEQVLLGVIADEPRSGYGLKKLFSSSPASVYQPSPGALYPALRRLEERGLLHAEKQAGAAVLMATHHVELATAAADHLLVLSDGTVVGQGTPDAALAALG